MEELLARIAALEASVATLLERVQKLEWDAEDLQQEVRDLS